MSVSSYVWRAEKLVNKRERERERESVTTRLSARGCRREEERHLCARILLLRVYNLNRIRQEKKMEACGLFFKLVVLFVGCCFWGPVVSIFFGSSSLFPFFSLINYNKLTRRHRVSEREKEKETGSTRHKRPGKEKTRRENLQVRPAKRFPLLFSLS